LADDDDRGKTPKFNRRDLLKGMTLFGAAMLLIIVERVGQYFLAPKESGPVTYPRLRIANTNDIPTNESMLFEYPQKDRVALLIHLPDGGWAAYDSLCTHLGCQVHYNKVATAGWENNTQQTFCPCHGGVYDPATGKVLAGPPPRPLPRIQLEITEDGEIFANGYQSGLPLYGEG
jgi:Rieske Fe-S protein